MRQFINSRQVFIVGDVHGCYLEFLELLKKVNYHKSSHRLILVGDIINRGPHSLKMLEWVKKKNVEIVRGNHEDAFLRSLKENYQIRPSFAKLKQEMGVKIKEWSNWIETWPFYIEEKDFLVVHGGLIPNKHPKDTDPFFLMNLRTWDGKGKDITNKNNPPWYDFYGGKKLIIYGHWASKGLNVKTHTIGLDSGCVYGKQLSGVLLPQKKIIQVEAQKKYHPLL